MFFNFNLNFKFFSSINIKNITITKSIDLLIGIQYLINLNECLSSKLPLSFENHSLPYTFVIYKTILNNDYLNFNTSNNLTIKNIKNIGYVFIDNIFQVNIIKIIYKIIIKQFFLGLYFIPLQLTKSF